MDCAIANAKRLDEMNRGKESTDWLKQWLYLHNCPGACYTQNRPDRTVWAIFRGSFLQP